MAAISGKAAAWRKRRTAWFKCSAKARSAACTLVETRASVSVWNNCSSSENKLRREGEGAAVDILQRFYQWDRLPGLSLDFGHFFQ
jgi:hypothetical protein